MCIFLTGVLCGWLAPRDHANQVPSVQERGGMPDDNAEVDDNAVFENAIYIPQATGE